MRLLHQLFGLLNRRTKRSAPAEFSVSPDVKATLRPHGAVLLDIQKGVVFTCNRAGARIWQGLSDREDVSAIAGGLAREYGVSEECAARDTSDFIASLRAEGLLA